MISPTLKALTISIFLTSSLQCKVLATEPVIINVDNETCILRGGVPISPTKCRLNPINFKKDVLDCKIEHRGCNRRLKVTRKDT